jgi:hypothetical protein
MRVTLASVAGFLMLSLTQHTGAQSENPLVGAWQRFSQSRADGTPNPQPETFVIFSANGHLSQTTLPFGRPKLTKPLQEMTREELLARFQGVQARLGTYAISDTKFIRKDVATLDPAEEGFDLVQEFRVEGDILTLISTAPKSKAVARFRRVK